MNKFLAYTWLAALSLTGMAASAENSHFLDVWAGGGYDALLHGMEHTRVPGGGGFHVGAGYELNAGNFLLQTGAEFQWLSSRTRLSGYAEDYPILSVEVRPLLRPGGHQDRVERHGHVRLGGAGAAHGDRTGGHRRLHHDIRPRADEQRGGIGPRT